MNYSKLNKLIKYVSNIESTIGIKADYNRTT
nr:MAG TPA: hypothetical protein [Caudoviricetes sp.]